MNKKSFILYTDYADKLSGLSDEQLGKLFRLILEYEAGDKQVSSDDQFVEFAFNMIKSDLNRNDDKYQKICEKRAENGRRGGLAKANKSQKLAEGVAIASNCYQMLPNASKCYQKLASVSKSKQNLANVADSHYHSHSHSHEGGGAGGGGDDTPPPVITGLGDFTPADIKRVARECVVDEEFARICLSRLVHWCRLKGRTYPDYYQALSHFIVTDRTYPMQRLRDPEPPTPPIKLPPKVPMTAEEAAKMRASMPAFIAHKKIDK